MAGTGLKAFVVDTFDRGAGLRPGTLEFPDLWRFGALAVSGGLSVSSEAGSFAHVIFGLSGSVVPILLAFAGFCWGWYLMTAKERRKSQFADGATSQVYAFHQPIRWIAKVGIVFTILLFGRGALALADDLTPLPTRICGYLVDGRTVTPADGFIVRIVDGSGVDVTASQLPSDSTGFYVVHTSRPVRRNATAIVSHPECSQHAPLALYRAFETDIDAAGDRMAMPVRPVFRHTLQCSSSR